MSQSTGFIGPVARVVVEIDDRGDLILVVGSWPESVIEFQVCSRLLARTSGVFESMLYGGFVESKPASGDWRVQLPEDDALGFRLVLDCLHYPRLVYGEIADFSPEDMERFFFVVDKYRLQSDFHFARDAIREVLRHNSRVAELGSVKFQGCSYSTLAIAWYLGDGWFVLDWISLQVAVLAELQETTVQDETVAARLDKLYDMEDTLGECWPAYPTPTRLKLTNVQLASMKFSRERWLPSAPCFTGCSPKPNRMSQWDGRRLRMSRRRSTRRGSVGSLFVEESLIVRRYTALTWKSGSDRPASDCGRRPLLAWMPHGGFGPTLDQIAHVTVTVAQVLLAL